ncbi:MAG TPA: hypothetical protein VLQ93_20905, partial [Myxococcaceae bacterium]|nr:hypothetical protein [Myxococcaceae bacterium]
MLRKILATVVVLLGALTGCTDLPLRCAQDSDCGAEGTCRAGMCFFDAPTVVDPGSCSPGCATYEVCTKNTAGGFECAARYSELKLVAPASGSAVDGGTVPVQAQLVPRPGVAPEYPDRLDYRVVRSDGGMADVGAVVATGAVSGTYSAQWTPPAEDGVFELMAAYPVEGGPSAKVQVTVDKTPPALAVVVPAAELQQEDGGFTYVDPGASGAVWRRDQTVRVEVRSDSADVDPSSLSVVVRGFAGGTDVTDLSLAQATPCDTASCWSVEVPLWRPGLPAFRGSFGVEVTAKDLLGNEAQASGNIPVTRWKWSFNGNAGTLKATPAIGQMGT